MSFYKFKQIAILGFARTALATADFLLKRAYQLRISDPKPKEAFSAEMQSEIERLAGLGVKFEFGQQTIEFIYDVDFVLLSPGIPPVTPIIRNIQQAQIPYGTDLDIFCQLTDIEYIAITGTNGKTTVTSLIAHILGVEAVGNIGNPILSEESEMASSDIKIIELSSFQLFYSNYLRAPKIAVYLNFSEDHLDWHSDLDEYRTAKEKIFLLQGSTVSTAVFNYDDPSVRAFAENAFKNHLATLGLSWDERVRFFSTQEDFTCQKESELLNTCAYLKAGDNNSPDLFMRLLSNGHGQERKIIKSSDLNLVGKHNYSNVLAGTLAVDAYGMDLLSIQNRLKTFKPVEHRMEFVREINGKKIYNDSKATNPDSAIRSLESFDQSIAIVGGKEKNLDMSAFLTVLSKKASYVIIIGEMKQRIYQELQDQGFTSMSLANSLEEAVDAALKFPKAYPVVFAPASSSFDMFKNYEERGRLFKEIVNCATATAKQ